MGSLSISTHRELVHWQGPLLVVLLLTFWSPPSTAEVSIVSTFTVEGKDVLLRILNKPPEIVGIVWYKGHTANTNNVIAFFVLNPSGEYLSGPGNNGDMITDDGSLLLKNVTIKDTGMYTVLVHLPGQEKDIASGLLYVYERRKGPGLRASRYWVTENEDEVALTCYTTGLSIQWLFNDTDLNFTNRMHLSEDRKLLTIDPVKREDAGVYKCIASDPFRRTESHPLELHVLHE
ncbi:carcinoembryonic antigen-related cell adhesion molecule 21-like [Artibeus jamaicensis]|uniref:carcinoembryonic antigen-related cell adhesion molecule 21-like n=1 Tax=Artibeus jamaicensis TaxID=9417 RepID=UPI00235AEDB4|nr:carcinoembryonic antigen-related cell adhesion molecule 21-like [Artibeus jamaicensis]